MDENNTLKCCLQQLLIELYRRKTEAQKGGAALEEPTMPEEPSRDFFLSAETVPYAEEIRALPTQEKTLADLVRERAANPQIDVFEAIANATPSADEPSSPAGESAATAAAAPSPSSEPFPDKLTYGERLRAWQAARSVWRVEKARRQEEYERIKLNVTTFCSGIDVGINAIEKAIRALDDSQAAANGGKDLSRAQ